MFALFLTLLSLTSSSLSFSGRPGPWIRPSVGEIWPAPQIQTSEDTFFSLHRKQFKIKLSPSAAKCEVLSKVSERFMDRIFPPLIRLDPTLEITDDEDLHLGELNTLTVRLLGGKCETLPYLHMDESYELKVNHRDRPGEAILSSASVWGILRGLESFSHLVHVNASLGVFVIKTTYIRDFPRFSYRGILIDSSRHFLSKKLILDTLDVMEMNKFNVLHWHITDDPSFPFVSKKFPELSAKGAYDSKTHVYSPTDVEEIIEHGRVRGIRILPEFDTPGHTQSWGLGVPHLLTPCYSGSQPNGLYGPINPILNSTYEFLNAFFEEVSTTFKDEYIHLGGDEVSFDCWKSNPSIRAFMKKHGFQNYAKLESYYIQRLLQIVKSKGKKYIVWNEVFENSRKSLSSSDGLVQVWSGDASGLINNITKMEIGILFSKGWYLDSNYKWEDFYKIDPLDHKFSKSTQKKYVLGGEGSLWTEYVNSNSFCSTLWPRACAIGEVLWFHKPSLIDSSIKRLQEQECRLLLRGHPVQSVTGPCFCKFNYRK